jgi:hypothetical protein
MHFDCYPYHATRAMAKEMLPQFVVYWFVVSKEILVENEEH